MPEPWNRRRFLTLAFSLPLATALIGCENNAGTQVPPTTAKPNTDKAPTKTIKAGLVTDTGGVGDKSFNAQAWAGLQKAKAELGAEIKYVESKQNADYVANLTKFAKAGYDVVFAAGYLMQSAVREVAGQFPKVKFALIDGKDTQQSNLVAYQFREEEGSFLAGAAAAMISKSGVIGFVGGTQSDLIAKFEFGYQAGAYTIKPTIQTRVGYVGNFDDTQKGQELALDQMGVQHADVVYHAAGKAGIGVIQAAKTKGDGFYAIGVDSDQDDQAPGRVLTSMVKRVDVAVFEVCQKVAADTFEGGQVVLGLKENGVGLSEMRHTKAKFTPEQLQKLDQLKQDIIAGKIHPPASANEYVEFTQPKDSTGS